MVLKAGTPQGSVNLINDVLINPTNKCDGGQSTDDISLCTLAKATKVTRVRLQTALRNLELWCST